MLLREILLKNDTINPKKILLHRSCKLKNMLCILKMRGGLRWRMSEIQVFKDC